MSGEEQATPPPVPAPRPVHQGGIQRSTSIKEITKAMVKFQSEIKLVPKATDNPFFKSKYADLPAIWTEIRKPLAANSVAVFHGVRSQGAKVKITTLLVHVSGEWMETEFEMEAKNAGAQAVGSVITYGKRYGISALLNVVSEGEDDDGEGAEGRGDGKAAAGKKQGKQGTVQPKAKAGAPNGAKAKKEWNWADKPPVWDPDAQKYKCSNCTNHCITKASDKSGTYFTYCDCRFAYDWEAATPEPFKSRLEDKETAAPKAAKGAKK